MHEMLESIQATNAAEDQEGWVKLTEEEIVQLNPDVIITTYGYYVDNPKAEQVLAREGWAEVTSCKKGQVFDVDSDTVTSPGPRLIEGVETLAELIYPEIFENKIGWLYILSGSGFYLVQAFLDYFSVACQFPIHDYFTYCVGQVIRISVGLKTFAKNEEMIIWNIRSAASSYWPFV